MNKHDANYLVLLERTLKTGELKSSRPGIDVLSLFCPQILEFDIGNGSHFPLITSKKIHWKSVVYELLWFIKGDTNIKYLNDNGVHIWDEWADKNGNLGPIYGKQLRNITVPVTYPKFKYVGSTFEYIDPLNNIITSIKKDPTSRRHVITMWNEADIQDMALPPCHGTVIQFYVRNKKYLDMYMYQRSGDIFLGVPFNIASYSLFLMMMTQVTGYTAGKFRYQIGDLHLYTNHIEQAKEQINRKEMHHNSPRVELNKEIKDITHFKYEDIKLCDYTYEPAIIAKVAV